MNTVHPGPFNPAVLSPTSFLSRAEFAYGDLPAVVDGPFRATYTDLAVRSRRLAGALASLDVAPGDRVSALVPNTHVALECHFGVPWAGAVLNMLNTRLNADELAAIVGHAGSSIILADHELTALATDVAHRIGRCRVIVAGGDNDEYEGLLDAATPLAYTPQDEWECISLNYTSGTTGRPKGVMYSHRGAYLQATAMVAATGLDLKAVFLWTLPMFHCNGWCFPWAVTAAGGTHLCLRRADPDAIWDAVQHAGVTHLNAAPTVLTALAYGPWCDAGPAPRKVRIATGGAPPSPALLGRLTELGLDVTHMYGLTETYGPAVVCDWQPQWDDRSAADQAGLKARQGVGNINIFSVRVIDSNGRDVVADAETPGEVAIRGDNVMLGYYRDEEATAASNIDGWFRTGDLGVVHPDGYLEVRDRIKDVIISGGENITSIEVEQALANHHAVLECAVVAAVDEKWGEVPVAFVTLRPGASASEAELIDHVKRSIARFKAPKQIRFCELPRTATGKIQKFALRRQLEEGTSPSPCEVERFGEER